MVLIVGEPGIGKSRLVLELARSIDERPEMVTWRQGRCLPYGEGVTFWPLSEILKAQAGILDTDDVATVETRLDAFLPQGADRAWLRQRLRPLVGLSATRSERDESFAAWARMLELIASDRPQRCSPGGPPLGRRGHARLRRTSALPGAQGPAPDRRHGTTGAPRAP